MSLPFINDTLGDLLNNYVHYITKQMQEIADSLWGSQNDNEDELITLPASIQTRGIFCICGYAVSDFSDYAPYGPTDFALGNFYELTSVNINYVNGNLNISGLNSLGRLGAYSWGNVNASCRDLAESIITEYISSHANDYIFIKEDYPDDPVTYEYSVPNDTIFFLQNNEQHVFETTFPKYDGSYYSADFCNIKFIDLLEMSGEYYVEKTLYIISENVAGRYVSQYGDGLFITNTNDQTFINNYISDNGATHNYTYTYETENGDTVTIYYGDNYVITKSDPDAETTYNEYKNALDIIVNKINEDGDYNITVPTYRENKYGPEPPTPDYSDDNFGLTTTGFSSNIGGAGNYWLMSLSNLAGFISDFKTTAPAGAMISQNILSCYVNALNYKWETGQDNIVIHASGAQNTPYTSTSQYDYIYQYNPHIVVGQYKVPRVTETFYDFNPYSTYELYIPFCGWIGLPDTVAGRNIRVYMDFDVATMSCKAYVMVEMEDGSGATICGEITGSFGAPCPVQVIEGGLYKQAMINSGLQIASGVVSGLMGGAFGGPVGASMLAEGGMNAVQGLASAYMAGNTNYGQTIGRAGDTSGLCGGHYCYIKITHPVIDEVVDTETFGHTTGYPCYMESELSDLAGTGFTVCLNPHVHVNCTQSEKDEIKQLLESGVIL